jgi:hypothetical protein
MGKFGEDEESLIMNFTIIASCLSLFGSLFILVCYCAFKDLRMFAFKLVALLSFADVCNSAGFLLGPLKDDSAACYFQAIVISYFSVCSVL